MSNITNLIYAIKNESIVHISEVESGLECGSVCPACGGRLIAKKGNKVIHHFAHYATKECEYGYETSLHLAAKEILSKSKEIMIPAVYVNFDTYKKAILISEAKSIKIDNVELEKHNDNIVPDVVVYSGGKKLFVEIFVSHRVGEKKMKKIRNLDVSTIEIDFSKQKALVTKEQLADSLIYGTEMKKWIYNSVANYWQKKFYDIAERKQIIYRGCAMHVDFCPIETRVWHGKPYANVMDDCICCEYCIEMREKQIMCLGRKGISRIEDFAISKEQRVKKDIKAEYARKNSSIGNDKCPDCNGKLVKRTSKYGDFVGCENFPKCKFKLSIDTYTGAIFIS